MVTKKIAAITGITGQDGSYLAELLLSKGYEVHGLRRRSSSFNTGRIEHLYLDPFEQKTDFFLHYGDMADSTSITRFLSEVRPTEIYNLAAQSHVAVSFETPEYTAETGGIGALRILEAIRATNLVSSTKFYQASTSELFGGLDNVPLNEKSAFRPRSPYASAKLYSYWTTVNYREAYGIWAANGILFNHESPRRGETFVTRKITRGLARVKHGLQSHLVLGNLNATRDWGHAKDFVNAMWLMLQQNAPDDFVIATGESHSVREFATLAAAEIGIELEWKGSGSEEVALDQNGKTVITLDKGYERPTEVMNLLGDFSKAKKTLNWKPTISFKDLVKEMALHDDLIASQESLRSK